MERFLREIRIHGRGGQGAVVLAELIAKAAFLEGKWPQAMAFFGAERRGAPVEAFARISDREILVRSRIYEPDYVVVLDPTLFEIVEVTKGLKRDGALMVNTPHLPQLPEGGYRVVPVDATGITLELKLVIAGQPVVNTAMLGVFAKATHEITLQSAERVVQDQWPGEIGKRNVEAVRAAYNKAEAQH